MKSRRDFLKETGLIAASLALAPSISNAFLKPKKAIGIQLYTLKDIIGKDVRGTIEKVAAAGFKEVETYNFNPKNNFWGLKPPEFKNLLDANGLASPSGHFGFDDYLTSGNLDELKPYIEASNILGTKYLVAPWLGEHLRKTADGYKKVTERLNIAGEHCAKSNLSIGYHNHGFEFKKFGDTTGFDIMLKESDSNLVHFELDIYWAVHAGRNPLELFKKYPKRFRMWHIKDMSKTNKEQNTEIGNGKIDFKSIFKQATLSGAEHFYLEQETNYQPNEFQSIQTSCDYIKLNLS